ncbi:MAG TPA: hypothetical protein VGW38_12975, partial [Chloroflexota bacterium]|nr:hypothetical protein [Chloroflexota bacterium]
NLTLTRIDARTVEMVPGTLATWLRSIGREWVGHIGRWVRLARVISISGRCTWGVSRGTWKSWVQCGGEHRLLLFPQQDVQLLNLPTTRLEFVTQDRNERLQALNLDISRVAPDLHTPKVLTAARKYRRCRARTAAGFGRNSVTGNNPA